MNYISPNNYTTSTIISDSINYTQNMIHSFKMEPYRNQFIILSERLQSDPSAAILFTYSLSFFMIASLIWCLTPTRNSPTVIIKSYTYEYESEEETDMDYTNNMYARKRQSNWKPHPMIRRSMDSSQTNE